MISNLFLFYDSFFSLPSLFIHSIIFIQNKKNNKIYKYILIDKNKKYIYMKLYTQIIFLSIKYCLNKYFLFNLNFNIIFIISISRKMLFTIYFFFTLEAVLLTLDAFLLGEGVRFFFSKSKSIPSVSFGRN